MKLRPYQEEAADFLFSNDRAMILAPVGAGKTAITLTAVEEMLRCHYAHRFLVVAPLRVATSVWQQEARKWAPKLRVAVDVDYAFDFSRSMLKSAASLVQTHQHMTCPHCRCDVKVSLPLTVHSRDVDRLAQIMGSVYQVATNRGITTNFLSDIKTNIQVTQLAKIKTQ